jgi:hypothetical protein
MKPVRKLKRKVIRFLFREQWSILLCDQNGTPLKEIIPPSDRIWADPFPVCHDGRMYLFLEEQVVGGKGILGCMEIHEDLTHGPVIPVLTLPYHLSWPNVFPLEKKGKTEWYMIPESNRAGSIECYRATRFPFEWVHDSTLMTGVRAADPELFHDGSTWFLFASIQDGVHGMNDSLFVFHSPDFPSSDWKPLPGNPVITGRTRSRMAGKMYRDENGLLVRPAQYSKGDYGQRIVLNRVETLSTTEYREKTGKTVFPERELKAVCTHTWNPCGPYVFRDIKKRFFDPRWGRKKQGTEA